ncbi:Esterase FE4 [Eumeta japonica]|uniref:Carboxylic ester hydrolase n=1 Tax=Eumeta variegata TaxID=151549 RepID=A0A4C1YC09_EUMVA|nr:Esterase FE4 [Eumeta japonica]
MLSQCGFGLLTTVVTNENAPVIAVAQGRLRGQIKELADGTSYYSFKGIPYAEPPVGQLRFKAPVPKAPWRGVYDAKDHGPICPQLGFMSTNLEGNEDCLFLNVYTKRIQHKSGKRAPVMVFIHGGSFMTGSGNSDFYGPEYLIQHDVILVTLNYRLEVFGFLSLDIEEVPGNAGLRDQVLALQWIKRNIAQFGGDPNNITIFGESSGAGAVTFHLVSPLANGLFNKAITESGVFLNDWADPTGGRQTAFRLGKHLGKETNDPKELLTFLENAPVRDLVNITFTDLSLEEEYRNLPVFFRPVIEKKFPNVKSYLDKPPMQSLLKNEVNKVPILVGYNSAEAIIMLDYNYARAGFVNQNFEYKVPSDLAKTISEAKSIEYGQRIKSFYFGGSDISESTLKELSELDSDIHFIYNIHRFLDIYKRTTRMPVYMYVFSCDTELNLFKKASNHTDIEGACHADELFYLFSSDLTTNLVANDTNLQSVIHMVTKLWTNFAKHGNSVPDNTQSVQWHPYTTESKEYLSIDLQLKMGKFSNKNRINFWNTLYSEANLPVVSESIECQ